MVTFLQDYFIPHDTVLEKIGLGFRGEKVVTGIHYFPVQFVCNRGRELWQKPFSTKINWKVLEFKCWLHSELTIEFSDVLLLSRYIDIKVPWKNIIILLKSFLIYPMWQRLCHLSTTLFSLKFSLKVDLSKSLCQVVKINISDSHEHV